jgi:hypothetical protein
MWRMPPRARKGIDTMGVQELLDQSPYRSAEVAAWLYDHDAHPWEATRMRYRIRGPSPGLPEESEEIVQFARQYHPKSGTPVGPVPPCLTPPSPELPPELHAMSDAADDLKEVISSGRAHRAEKDRLHRLPPIPRTGFVCSVSSQPRIKPTSGTAAGGPPISFDPPSGASMGDTRSAGLPGTMLHRLERAKLLDMM